MGLSHRKVVNGVMVLNLRKEDVMRTPIDDYAREIAVLASFLHERYSVPIICIMHLAFKEYRNIIAKERAVNERKIM